MQWEYGNGRPEPSMIARMQYLIANREFCHSFNFAWMNNTCMVLELYIYKNNLYEYNK